MRKAGSNENLSGIPKVTSEVHDVLYSKTRYVLSQRHIKRPWFNLNPFLEKTDESIDLENFFPGENKYIQPLESLVLCESFHSNLPVDTREMSIDAFFPYLFSKEWGRGCSIRVLEGQLLDQLLIGLYRLENEGTVVRHTTHALAKNQHLRTGCYKFADKESSGSIKETLLIEFAYFGRLTKDKPNPKTLNAFEYLEKGLSENEYTNSADEFCSDLPPTSEQEITGNHRDRAMNMSVDGTKQLYSSSSDNKPKWGRGSLMSKHVTAIRFINAFKTDDRRQTTAGPNQQLLNKRKVTTGLSPLTESRRLRGNGNLSPYKQKRQESVRADDTNSLKNINERHNRHGQSRIVTLDLDDDFVSALDVTKEHCEAENTPRERDNFFGEEFYLSNQKNKGEHKFRSANKILQQKKRELHARREEAKRQRELDSEKRKIKILPEFPKLDMDDLEAERVKYDTINMPDEMPTLEEFVHLLKDDEYYDPRFRNKVRLKSKKIAQRYYKAKELHRESVMYNLGDIPDEIRNISTFHHGSRKSTTTVSKQKDSVSGRDKGNRQFTLPVIQSKQSLSISNVQERGQEVLAVTDSEPCKDHYVKNKRQSVAETSNTISTVRKVIPNRDMSTHRESINQSESTAPLKTPLFPKITIREDEIESSDTSSDESTDEDLDDYSDTDFDTKKLNLKFSIERLRKKRRSRVKKKGGFIGVLAKYYMCNMQSALRVFKGRNGSTGGKKNRLLMKLGKMKQQGKQVDKKMVVGKLRKFNFLDVKDIKKTNLDQVSQGDFSSSNLVEFQKKLNKALDMFVVRREIVVSDITTFYTATTFVTFTKPSCFQHKHTSCKD